MITDTTAPASDCVSQSSQGPFYTITPADGSVAVTWTEPTWTDDSGVSPTITKSPNTNLGATLDVGSITITYTATDGSSNVATCVVTLDVQGTDKRCTLQNNWIYALLSTSYFISECRQIF